MRRLSLNSSHNPDHPEGAQYWYASLPKLVMLIIGNASPPK